MILSPTNGKGILYFSLWENPRCEELALFNIPVSFCSLILVR